MAARASKNRVPKLYGDVNSKKPREHYDYENFKVMWGNLDDYEVTKKIGRGKYSEVFQGYHLPTNKGVVIKVLKPVKKKKIKREIKILKNVSAGPNVVELLDVVRDPLTKTPCLVFEHINNIDWKTLYPTFKLEDIKFYMYELLRAVDYAHSQGLIHRDLKPHNIMIDHARRQLRVIDWGLAEFYHPRTELNVRVASRHYKGPELLVDDRLYDYSLDIWSIGCTLAGMIFKKEPFFYGNDNADQMKKIVQVLGSAGFIEYLDAYGLSMDAETQERVGGAAVPPRDWMSFANDANKDRICSEAIDLISKMLVYDPTHRITCKDAMEHPFFDCIRK